MSPQPRGRPAGRGRSLSRRRLATRQWRLSDVVLRDTSKIAGVRDALAVERWASGWLGRAWVTAALREGDPERRLCREVADRARVSPSPLAHTAVAALRRVAPESEQAVLDETLRALAGAWSPPGWLASPGFSPVRAWRAVDVWGCDRVLFVEWRPVEPAAVAHTLMAQILTAGGTLVNRLAVLGPDAARSWALGRDADAVPMPLVETPVVEVLADLAAALRMTDMVWPHHDDRDFIDTRALAWARCREYLPDWPVIEPLPDAERRELVAAFLAESGVPDQALPDAVVVGSLAELFLEYGDGFLHTRPLGWSPNAVAMLLVDWLPRKAILDPDQRRALPEALRRWMRFALHRRGVGSRWVDPVLAAIDEYAPMFTEVFEDDRSWGPAEQAITGLAGRPGRDAE